MHSYEIKSRKFLVERQSEYIIINTKLSKYDCIKLRNRAFEIRDNRKLEYVTDLHILNKKISKNVNKIITVNRLCRK